jgi:sugar phosphate isomerase/epimerase
MHTKFFRATWGMQGSIEMVLHQIKDGGFDGVEMGAPDDAGERNRIIRLLADLDLALIVQMWTAGRTPDEHAQSFEAQYRRAAEMHPILVNVQTGRDIFTQAENLRLVDLARKLEVELGVPVAHETHRGRMTYSVPGTMALLSSAPGLRLTADFSHWCCVHESLLADQSERLEAAMQHVVHIHARVGHAEGPQVNDPRAPEWREAVSAHIAWWQRIADIRRAQGAEVLTITPEFGPPDYMPTLPYTRQPVADLWDVNVFMMNILRERMVVQV